jgi:hypothetical protein
VTGALLFVWWSALLLALLVGTLVPAFVASIPLLAISLVSGVHFRSRLADVRARLFKADCRAESGEAGGAPAAASQVPAAAAQTAALHTNALRRELQPLFRRPLSDSDVARVWDQIVVRCPRSCRLPPPPHCALLVLRMC